MKTTNKPRALPPRPGAKAAKSPAHLNAPERVLWRQLLSAHRFDDAASLALLRTAMEAHMRARRCREAIDRDGEAVSDRFGQTKSHPLLPAERDARSAFLAAMKLLGLDMTGN